MKMDQSSELLVIPDEVVKIANVNLKTAAGLLKTNKMTVNADNLVMAIDLLYRTYNDLIRLQIEDLVKEREETEGCCTAGSGKRPRMNIVDDE